MLVLSRRPGESITIGENIVVTVLSASGNQIRLGIRAPREVKVLREEIYEQMQHENHAAVIGSDPAQRLESISRLLRVKRQEGSRE